jgi:hypothetical protein
LFPFPFPFFLREGIEPERERPYRLSQRGWRGAGPHVLTAMTGLLESAHSLVE